MCYKIAAQIQFYLKMVYSDSKTAYAVCLKQPIEMALTIATDIYFDIMLLTCIKVKLMASII